LLHELQALDVNAEEAHRESEQRFSRAFQNSQVAMALIDQDANFLHVNDRACQLIGYSRQEFLGLSPENLLRVIRVSYSPH
jgi:PAS domain S-box-containing protein